MSETQVESVPRIVCAACGGANVEIAVWFEPNAGVVVEPFGSGSCTDTNWCRDCDGHVELVDDHALPKRRAQ
jgi:hypothetical protein